jgi:hypothetical protein
MKIEISEDILSATKCCKRKSSCINDELNQICKVTDCINGVVHFVKPVQGRNCEYQQLFGYSCFCSCPLRKEIFRKYGQ